VTYAGRVYQDEAIAATLAALREHQRVIVCMPTGVGKTVTFARLADLYLRAGHRVLVLAHSDCRMASGDEAALHAAIAERSGIDTRDLVLGAIPDQRAALTEDVERLRASAHLPEGLVVGAAMLDVADGLITPVDA
jgi:carbonic anhydrase